MLGLFNRFGRSRDLRLLDQEIRAAGLHPALVPEAVKLTTLRLLKDMSAVTPEASRPAAELLVYCILGPAGFAEENGERQATEMEERLHRAIDAGDSLDARLVLLALHADLVQAEIVRHYGLEADRS